MVCICTMMKSYKHSVLLLLMVFSFISCMWMKQQEKQPNIVVGEIADLHSDRFSGKSWRKGLDDPTDFMHRTGFGIYFLEKYDDKKIPVLFINGIYSSPQAWELFFKGIDRKLYQPWFFSYPTGISLSKSAQLLNKLVKGLHEVYGFKKMYVTAHGTGGLVGRAFILDNRDDESQDYLDAFIAIATPWGGVTRRSVMMLEISNDNPALIDVRTGSSFLKTIFSKKMDITLDYYIFLAYRGGKNSFGSLSSQLNIQVQSEAVKEYGFHEDYLSILSSGEVLQRYNKILALTN